MMHRVLLDAARDEKGRVHCWDGLGRYMGWQGLGQLSDWTNKYISNFVFLIFIGHFFDRISDLLDPIKFPE